MKDKTNEISQTNSFVYYNFNIVNKVISFNEIRGFIQLKLLKIRKEDKKCQLLPIKMKLG